MAALYANEAVGSKDFNPDQLRDDRGQWTDMPGAHVGGRSTPYWDTPESQVLASWTGAESGAIQKGYEKGKPVSERAKLFDRALKALPPLPVGTPVLRAVNLDLRDPEDPVYRLHKPEDIADYYRSQIGDVITYEHPESASTQPLAAEKFTRGPGRARVVFDIDTPQAKSVAEFASHREAWESEAVVPPGKYRITGVEIREFLVAGDRGPGQPGGDTIRIAVVKLKDINEAIKSGKTMEHILLKAVATTTDQGIFEAVISTESVDREKDIVSATGMVDALHKWNRPIPLAWNHSTKAEDIFGHLDPQSAKEVSSEVVATGQVDLESQMGQEAWRSFKNRTIGFSFGYLIPEGGATNRKGGGRHITALDIFEVTATPTPMNNDTRVLSTKSADELRKESDRLERELVREQLPDPKDAPEAEETEPQPTIEDLFQRLDAMDQRIEVLSVVPAKSAEELRRESEQLERELAREDLPETKDAPESDPAPTTRELADLIADVTATVNDKIEFLLAQVGVKAIWTTAYINGLPDSAFLYIESGGTKDSEGKTVPRSLRHFPVKDAEGNVDMPHLRNAMARISQSNLPQDVKDRCVAKAQRMMDAQKSADSQRLTKARPVDDLRRLSERAVLEIQSDGVSLRKPPRQVEEKAEVQAPPEDALRRQSRDLMFQLLREGIGDDAQ